MKFLKIKNKLAITILFLVSLSNSLETYATNITSTSDATIEFTTGFENIFIMDPQNPTIETGDAITLTSLLSLNHVSSFAFGAQPVSASKQIYYSKDTAPFIQVTDIRGTQAGWKVVAQMSAFSDGTKASLDGAELTLSGGELVSSIEGNLSAPTSPSPIKLASGGPSTLVTDADAGTGMGTWLTRWLDNTAAGETNNKVSLYVPVSSMTIGIHTATITWTLSDAP